MNYETLRLIFMVSAILAGISLLASILIFIILRIPSVIGDLSGATARKAINDIRNGNELSGSKTYKASAVNKERGKLTDKISASGNLVRSSSTTTGFAMGTQKISTAQLSSEAMEAEANHRTTLLEQATEVLAGNGSDNTTVLTQNGSATNETSVLSGNKTDSSTTVLSGDGSNATSVLSNNQTTVGETTVILNNNASAGETSVLSDTYPTDETGPISQHNSFTKTLSLDDNSSGDETTVLTDNAAKNAHVFNLLYDITVINTQEIIP